MADNQFKLTSEAFEEIKRNIRDITNRFEDILFADDDIGLYLDKDSYSIGRDLSVLLAQLDTLYVEELDKVKDKEGSEEL